MTLKFRLRQVLKQTFFAGLLALALASPVLSGTASAALSSGAKNEACIALEANKGTSCDPKKLNASSDKLSNTASKIINIFTVVVGIAAIIMVIISGFLYVTSGGDSNNITTAKRTLIYALVGLVLVAFAQIIVKFILNRI